MIFSPSPTRGRKSSTLRILLMLVLFVAVGYMFWVNYERSMETIHTRHMVSDQTQAMDPEVQQKIASFSRNLQQRFGIGVQVRIFSDTIVIPPQDSRTVFIGLSPRHKEDVIVFTPILERALPREYIDYMHNEHFFSYWEDGNWEKGLLKALNLLGEEIMKIERGD